MRKVYIIALLLMCSLIFASPSYAQWEWKIIEVEDRDDCFPGDKPDERHQVRLISGGVGKEELFRTECYDDEGNARDAVNLILENICTAQLPPNVNGTCPSNTTP